MTAANGTQPQGIPVQPVPSSWTINHVHMADGSTSVIAQVHTPVGVFGFFLGPDEAVGIGELIARYGKQARSGLILPPGVT